MPLPQASEKQLCILSKRLMTQPWTSLPLPCPDPSPTSGQLSSRSPQGETWSTKPAFRKYNGNAETPPRKFPAHSPGPKSAEPRGRTAGLQTEIPDWAEPGCCPLSIPFVPYWSHPQVCCHPASPPKGHGQCPRWSPQCPQQGFPVPRSPPWVSTTWLSQE